VVKARVDGSDDPRNAECVYLVLSWSTGSFEFVPEAVDGDDEVAASTTHLLMEAARLQDEQSQL
jgi:hypothetical protein